MRDLDDSRRGLTREVKALHSRIAKLEQTSHNLLKSGSVDEELDRAWREWETTFDATKDVIILTDNEFTIVQANLATSQLFGKPLDRIVGMTCWQLVHGTDHPPKDCPLKTAKGTKKHEEIELYLPEKNVWVIASVDPVFDQQGNLCGAIHIIRDVTDRKQAERLLRKERDRAQKYLDVAGVMLVAIDAEQRVGLINKKGCEILGYNEDEIVAKNWFDNFLPKRIKEEVKGVFNKLLCGEADAPEYYENPVLTKDGAERLIAWHNTVLRDDKGKVIATLGSGEDITERKLAEEALRKSEHEKSLVLDNASEIIAYHDTDQNILWANKAYLKATGLSLSQIEGKKCYRAWGLDRPCKDCPVIKTIKTGEPQSAELTPQNQPHWPGDIGSWLSRAAPVKDKTGSIIGAIEVAYDITEHKKAEDALRESEEKYRDLFENAREAIVTLDLKGNITDVNKLVEEYGFKQDQLIGKSHFDFIAEKYRDNSFKEFKKLTRGIPVVGEVELITPKGNVVVEYRNNPIRRGEQIVGVQEVLIDITERKRAEEEIAKLARFPEENPNPIIRVSAEGTVLYSNKPAFMLLGAWGCSVGQSLPSHLQRLVFGTLKSGRVHEVEVECADHIFSIRLAPIAGTNYVNIYGRDITTEKLAKQKLIEDQAQLKSLASQLTLAEEHERRRLAVELHDRISQSLVISKIKLEALRKCGYGEKLDKALDEVCNSIGQTIQHTRTLTFDLGSPVLYELGFEMAVSEWLTSQIQQKHGLAVEFEDDGRPKPLEDDVRILLFRDVRELLVNIVKHAAAHKVKVSIKKVGKQICVTVEDDGVGFDPAEVLSMAARRGEFGHFSIRERLEQLGGHLEINSKPNCGCRVTIVAPLKKEKIEGEGKNEH